LGQQFAARSPPPARQDPFSRDVRIARQEHNAMAEFRPNRFDRLTWTRWHHAVKSFAGSPDAGGRAKLLFAALLVLLLAINGLNVVNSYVGRDFMTAVEQRSMPRFLSMALLYVGVFAASTVAAVLCRYAEERLALLWRDWLTRRLVGFYLADATYYWLREREFANPDQRIADDVRVFSASTLSLTLVLLNTTFTILAFSSVMWSISPLLFGVAVAYAALGSGLTVLFGRSLIGLNYNQADREANLRGDLVHLRANAESVAVLHREGRIAARLQQRVDDLVANAKRIIGVNRNLGFFTTGYNYLIQIIPVLIVAPLFIRGEAEFGVIPQSAMAFSHLVGAYSLVVTQFQQISGLAVVVARLSDLAESTEGVTARSAGGIEVVDGAAQFAWEGLSLRTRLDGTPLLHALDLAVPAGKHVLVTGPNEAARMALFRASAGLWRAGEGRILRPPPGGILFIPERPYLPPGTLRDALLRTQQEGVVDEARMAAVLRVVGIEQMVARAGGLTAERDWDEVLPLADQQRLAFARVLLAAPRIALLQGPDMLLGTEVAGHLIELLQERSITVVTFAADEALADHHALRLVLEANGTWTSQPIHIERPVT
jgi:putative ATP-binding cassette transporter